MSKPSLEGNENPNAATGGLVVFQPTGKDPQDQYNATIEKIQQDAYEAGAHDYAETLDVDSDRVNIQTASATAMEIQSLRTLALDGTPTLPPAPTPIETALVTLGIFAAVYFTFLRGK